MALKQSKLEQIHPRNRDLAFGYVRNCENQNKASIPEMIKYLCLLFLNSNKDKFDPDNTSKSLRIEHNSVSQTDCAHREYAVNTFLFNEVTKRVHVWKFKCNYSGDRPQFDQIGIWKVNSGHLVINSESCYFDGLQK